MAWFVLLIALMLCRSVQAAAGSAASPSASILDIARDKQLSSFREPLISYLKSRHVRRDTSVCILGERYADGTKAAWILWESGRTLLLWDGGDSSMVGSRRILDLDRDVVDTESAIDGSTYLVTKAWVRERKAKCAEKGTKVRVTESELTRKKSAPHE